MSVLQLEVTNATEQRKVRVMTKAAVLQGDPDCPDLVAFSVYVTKPIHFLSMACMHLKWIEKTKMVYNRDEKQRIAMSFL